jgi:hypothetical protein
MYVGHLVLLFTISTFSFFLPSLAKSHSGGLDSSGCHGGSVAYHCHRSASDMTIGSNGRPRLRCDLGSRSVECNGGAAFSSNVSQVLSVQIALKSHCNDYSPKEIGNWTSSDQGAIARFQAAYGLQIDGILGPQTIGALNGPVIAESALQC